MGVGVVIQYSIVDFLASFFKRAPIQLDFKMAEADSLNWAIQTSLRG